MAYLASSGDYIENRHCETRKQKHWTCVGVYKSDSLLALISAIKKHGSACLQSVRHCEKPASLVPLKSPHKYILISSNQNLNVQATLWILVSINQPSRSRHLESVNYSIWTFPLSFLFPSFSKADHKFVRSSTPWSRCSHQSTPALRLMGLI